VSDVWYFPRDLEFLATGDFTTVATRVRGYGDFIGHQPVLLITGDSENGNYFMLSEGEKKGKKRRKEEKERI
jgi:hypothetical protein